MFVREQGSISLQSVHNFSLPACCVWKTSMSVESRAPAVSRTAPTTPGVMNVTAQQDTDSTQTDVAVMVCSTLNQNVDGTHSFMRLNIYLC